MSQDDLFEIEIENDGFQTPEGYVRIEKAKFKTRNSIWSVHKYDPDPFPSCPHAHCIEGMYRGYKLHLGSGKLFDGAKPTDFTLQKKQFQVLCKKINERFEEFDLPLKP